MSMFNKRLIIAFFIAFVVGAGCATVNTAVDTRDTRDVAPAVPGWVLGDPNMEGMVCAIGISGPTFYPEDAKKYAAQNAREELARTLSVSIKSIMIDSRSERDGSLNKAAIVQVSTWATNIVLKESQILEYWCDTEGALPQGKGFTYALCCMPRESLLREYESSNPHEPQ